VYVREDMQKARRFFWQTARTCLLISILPAILLGLAGPPLFRYVFGAEWSPAGILAALMAPWMLAQLSVAPLSRLIFVLGGQETKLIYDGFGLLLTISAFLGASAARLDLAGAIGLLSGLRAVAYVIYFIILARIVAAAPGRDVDENAEPGGDTRPGEPSHSTVVGSGMGSRQSASRVG
jgi:O-antigen/teichoic acid export membrane protein